MTLRERQSAFTSLVARLILFGELQGYAFTFGEAYRSPEEATRLAAEGKVKAIRKSLHCDRLAIDLNLFKDGIWLTKSEDYTPLGEWWEAQSTVDFECAWGGRFEDGNHFSAAFQGRK